MQTDTLEITAQDIEYIRHGDRAMTLRLFTPPGAGPFPVVLDLHGGAWTKGHMTECYDRDETLAKAGFAAAALDFRHAADAYPSSLVDINYAVRWLKAHANDYRLDAGRVALCGQSSGGHLAMLAAMRPRDARYSEIALPGQASAVDASVNCVGMLWPVINPLSRYRHAKRALTETPPPGWVGDIPERHDLYWKTEEAMAEGNPMLALERGEAVQTPPALWVQGQPDAVHDYRDLDSDADLNEPERFARNYRNAGGEIEIRYIDNAERQTRASVDPLLEFLEKNLGR
ncbi:MAG TPA: alpha/beta hydrolase fold domain-containing protein [Gammaproteobacteria bacterium]